MLRGFLALLIAAELLASDDWPRFRGPNGSGVAQDSGALPERFGPGRNAVWKTAVPPGTSSPVVAGRRLWVTRARGSETPGRVSGPGDRPRALAAEQ